jgi:predicted TIM-barrel fold metal-dependent hydrolase
MKIIDSRVRLRTPQLLKIWDDEHKNCYSDYIHLYKMKSRLSPLSAKELIDVANGSDIGQIMAYGITEEDNKEIISLSKQFNEIIPVAGVSVEKGIRYALRDLKKYFDEGCAAIFLSPFSMKYPLNDRLLYPLYGFCELMQKPIYVHGVSLLARSLYVERPAAKH